MRGYRNFCRRGILRPRPAIIIGSARPTVMTTTPDNEQKGLDGIDVHLVVARALTADDELKLRAHVLKHLEHPFAVSFVYVGGIPRSASGKYEDFRCGIAAPA